MNARPRTLILIAFLLLVFGAVAPFLTVIGVLASTFLLNFVAYFASIIGLFLGVIGVTLYVGETRRRNDPPDL